MQYGPCSSRIAKDGARELRGHRMPSAEHHAPPRVAFDSHTPSRRATVYQSSPMPHRWRQRVSRSGHAHRDRGTEDEDEICLVRLRLRHRRQKIRAGASLQVQSCGMGRTCATRWGSMIGERCEKGAGVWGEAARGRQIDWLRPRIFAAGSRSCEKEAHAGEAGTYELRVLLCLRWAIVSGYGKNIAAAGGRETV